MNVYFLSFVDPERPKGQQFLGGCLVKAPFGMPALAVREAWTRRCNPGGECMITEIQEPFPDAVFERYGNRLLDRAECEEMDGVLQATMTAAPGPDAGAVQ